MSVPDKSAKIWRYVDFTKFVSLLAEKAMFFSRADKLDDTWEGAFTKQNVQTRAENWKIDDTNAPVVLPLISAFLRGLPSQTFISCWHLNNFESAAMWKLYLSSNEGIAIQSTYGRLISSFVGDVSELARIRVGIVRYLDYDRDSFPEGSPLAPFLHKRLSFEHERELRAIIQQPFPGDSLGPENPSDIDGLLAHVNLDTLVESLYVAPTAPQWFTDLVKDAVARYGFTMSIKQSNLGQDPIY